MQADDYANPSELSALPTVNSVTGRAEGPVEVYQEGGSEEDVMIYYRVALASSSTTRGSTGEAFTSTDGQEVGIL